MSPDRGRKAKTTRRPDAPPIKTGPTPDDEHDIVYFQRPEDKDPDQSIPGREFLHRCPPTVRAKFATVLIAVATAPPMRFSGGGYWEAMKGDMTGWFEVRADGPQRHHYRLYCRLDYDAKRIDKPLLVVVTGLDKPFKTKLTDADYAGVRTLGEEYLRDNPRSVV